MKIRSRGGRYTGAIAAATLLFCLGCKQSETAQTVPAEIPEAQSRQVRELAQEAGYAADSGKSTEDVAKAAAQQVAEKLNQNNRELDKAAE